MHLIVTVKVKEISWETFASRVDYSNELPKNRHDESL